ncbi:hypothetical protein [Luteolibacter soli]|uniref:hypothetical protein n=1 Tax=Luteolibacter soli TaxID=3135280 RepID=UPI0035C8AA23
MREEFSEQATGIQPHGLLFALHGDDFLIGQVSANVARVIGRDSQELVGKPFLDLVEPSTRASVEAALRGGWRADGDSFHVTVRTQGQGGGVMSFEGIVHLLPGGIRVVEMERDPVLHQGGASPSPGSDSSLRLVSRSLAAVADLTCPDEIVRVLAREIQRFTGFHRVMVERLDEDDRGEIVADEHVAGIESFLGLHLRGSSLPAISPEHFPAGQHRHFYDAATSPVMLVPPLCPLGWSRCRGRGPRSTSRYLSPMRFPGSRVEFLKGTRRSHTCRAVAFFRFRRIGSGECGNARVPAVRGGAAGTTIF